MNLKKAIVATLVVSSMLAALAGPIPAGAEGAQEKQQEQQQSDSKKVQIDKKQAAKLQKAVRQYAGKEIKLEDVGELKFVTQVTVQSVDGKYGVFYNHKSGQIGGVFSKTTIDKISKKDQDEILKVLKGMYSKKTYAFDKEVHVERYYDNKKENLRDYTSYTLTGKDFTVELVKNHPSMKEYINGVMIFFDKKELEPKLLKTAAEAVKTTLDHDFDVTKAHLSYGGLIENTWMLQDDKVTIYMESGKVASLINEQGNKVTTNKEMTEKEAKEAVAPIAKKLFNIDITGYEVKWDNLFKDYRFIEKNDVTTVRAALDADKNVVYIKSGSRAAAGN
ncbi:hypothetical protein [Paenibacillus apiarius]|uniref:hypothetical protein n=1 Tax=Paenibacillus apiarius TaxID=46240 RepID=UPI003B39FB31